MIISYLNDIHCRLVPWLAENTIYTAIPGLHVDTLFVLLSQYNQLRLTPVFLECTYMYIVTLHSHAFSTHYLVFVL